MLLFRGEMETERISGDSENVQRNIFILFGTLFFGLPACDACDKDSPREEIREDLQETGENIEDAVDESRVGMNR